MPNAEKAIPKVEEEPDKEVTPLGEIHINVFESKPVEVVISGKIVGKHIPRVKRKLTRTYLNWIKSRRKK